MTLLSLHSPWNDWRTCSFFGLQMTRNTSLLMKVSRSTADEEGEGIQINWADQVEITQEMKFFAKNFYHDNEWNRLLLETIVWYRKSIISEPIRSFTSWIHKHNGSPINCRVFTKTYLRGDGQVHELLSKDLKDAIISWLNSLSLIWTFSSFSILRQQYIQPFSTQQGA